MKSLFGDEIPAEPYKRNTDMAHAAPPGTGPEGETCRTCRHRYRIKHNTKVYQKCGLLKHHWSHGPGTDIRAKDKACRHWEKDESED